MKEEKNINVDGNIESADGKFENEKSKRFYTKGWFIASCAAFAFIAVFAIITLVAIGSGYTWRSLFGMSEKELDYLKDPLYAYIDLDKSDYKKLEVEVALKKPGEEELERKINSILASNRGEALYGGSFQTKKTIEAGNDVYLYYQGYIIEDGRRMILEDLSNFTSGYTALITAGKDMQTLGEDFSHELIGKVSSGGIGNIRDYGEVVSEQNVIYATVSFVLENGLIYDNVDVCFRPSDDDFEEIWGEGAYEKILKGKSVGGYIFDMYDFETLTTKESGKKITYTDLEINYIITNDYEPITITSHFPQSHYDNEVAGKEVYFDVYIEHTKCYAVPSFDDAAFVNDKLGLKEADLEAYSGDTLAEKCRSYYNQELLNQYNEQRLELAKSEMWKKLKQEIKIIRYPESEIDRIYLEYIYNYSLALAEANAAGEGYEDLDEYIVAQLDLPQGADWTGTLIEMVRSDVKENLIIYAIMRRENLVPNEEEYQQIYMRELELDFEYAEGKSRADYDSDEKYEQALSQFEKKVIEYYGVDGYRDSVYYHYISQKLIEQYIVIVDVDPKSK